MSIATKRGDAGKTSLVGGTRVSKSNPRVECYGTIDELLISPDGLCAPSARTPRSAIGSRRFNGSYIR